MELTRSRGRVACGPKQPAPLKSCRRQAFAAQCFLDSALVAEDAAQRVP